MSSLLRTDSRSMFSTEKKPDEQPLIARHLALMLGRIITKLNYLSGNKMRVTVWNTSGWSY